MLWIQGLHVIFVVTWFAGLFYLPRIFVYYAQAEDDTTRTTLAIMARKLYKFVTPLMMLVKPRRSLQLLLMKHGNS